MRPSIALLALGLAACGGAHSPPPATTTEPDAGTPAAPAPIERACFTGSTANGVCEIFDGSLEPLTALSQHCQSAGGTWLDACPAAGRVGTCSGDGRRAVYYGTGLTPETVRDACEHEGHTFVP